MPAIPMTATESDVEPAWAEGVDFANLGRTVYARLTVPTYESQVTVSIVDTRDDDDNRRLREIVADITPRVALVEFVDYRPDSDYFSTFFDAKFWLLRPGQSLPCDVRKYELVGDAFDCIAEREEELLFWSPPDKAEELIRKAARVRTLTKLEGLTGPSSLAIDVELRRGMDAPVSRILDPGPLYPGDEVYYSVENGTKKPWDIFFFYVASNLQIQALQAPGQSARILPGERVSEYLGEIDSSTIGTESLVMIADPVARVGDGVEADYSFLEQDAYVRSATKGAQQGDVSPVQDALETLWEESGEYSVRVFGSGQDETRIRVFTWTVETQ